MPERPADPELEKATNTWMIWGFAVMILMVAIFPVYRWYEPSTPLASWKSEKVVPQLPIARSRIRRVER